MCGIAGMYRFGGTPIRGWQLEMLASSLEYRGNDATGFAVISMNGETHWFKKNLPAWQILTDKEFKEWEREFLPAQNQIRIALVHTRKATKGSPHKPENNHPMVANAGLVVHNGWINNDDELFTAHGDLDAFKRSCQTDSDAIRAILDMTDGVKKETIDEMCVLEGVAAVGAIHPRTPDKLLLLRDGNPLMLGSTEDMLFFASDKRAIHRAAKPWVWRHKTFQQVHAPDIAFVPMNNKSGYIFGPGGLEYHTEFECAGQVHNRDAKGTSYAHMTDYHQRQERFANQAKAVVPPVTPGVTITGKDVKVTTPKLDNTVLSDTKAGVSDNPKYVVCPNDACLHVIDFEGSEFAEVPLDNLVCGACSTNLSDAKIINNAAQVN